MSTAEQARDNSQPQNTQIDSMALFRAELNHPAHDLLTPAREQTLLLQLHDPDQDRAKQARDLLAEANISLVISIAAKYTQPGRGLGLELSDLISEGTCGLMRAIDRFDPKKGTRLSTYATRWIRQAIGRALDNGGIVQLPANKIGDCRLLKKTQADLSQKHQREPTVSELAQTLAFANEKAEMLLNLINQGDRQVTSLDESPRSTETPISKVNFVVDPKANPEKEVLAKEALQKILALFDKLPGQERKVMKLVVALVLNGYTLCSVSSPIQATIARIIGVKRQRVEQIMKQALKRLTTDPSLIDETAEVRELLTS